MPETRFRPLILNAVAIFGISGAELALGSTIRNVGDFEAEFLLKFQPDPIYGVRGMNLLS